MPFIPRTEPEEAPRSLWIHDIAEMLEWFELNLCGKEIRDPRGHRINFSIEHFCHSVKLLKKNSDREVDEPKKQALAIKAGKKGNQDFNGYDEERVRTLGWTAVTIQRPTRILESVSQLLLGKRRAGDTLYIKEFSNTKRSYRFKVMVCRRVGSSLLIPVTCHPQDNANYSASQYVQVWP